MSSNVLHELLSRCNRTELYQLCVSAALVVTPKFTRQELANVLVGEQEDGEENPLDPWRHALATFVLQHWTVLQNQVTCPLKSKNPMSCFGCLDAQVVSCLNDNFNYLHLIQIHKKSRKDNERVSND